MRRLLTDIGLQRLKVTRRTEVYDTQLRGFGVVVQPSGHLTFFVRYRWRGKQPRMKLGTYGDTSLKDARAAAAEALAKAQRGVNPAGNRVPRRKQLTVEQLATAYLEEYAKPRKRTWKQDRNRIDREVVPFWGDALAGEVTRQDAVARFAEIAGRAPYEANRVRSLVSRIYTWAIATGKVEQNPVEGTMAPTKEAARERALTDVELEVVWRTLVAEDSPAARAYRVFLLTAAREAAVLGLREAEVVGSWATVPAERMKRDRAWRLYLGPLARAAVGEPGEGGFYFASPRKEGKPITSLSTAMRRLKDRTGIADFGYRTLRKTVATGMAALGVPPHVIDEVLAHAPATVGRKHYNLHSYDAEKRDAWLLWERHVREVVGLADEPAKVVPIR